MEELQKWLDYAPTLRRAELRFDGAWFVELSELSNFLKPEEVPRIGRSTWPTGGSLTFAVVAAILDYRKNQEG